MSIQVRDISKKYGLQLAVDNISFTINSGEIAGFIGPNGAGKSTTMKIITGTLPPDQGEVVIRDMPSIEYQKEIRKIIGYLPEHNPLYLEMYIREYLSYVAGLYRITGLKARNRVDQVIELTGLSMEAHKRIGTLSKGYRQRVGLAQALVNEPEILILDEPTSGLDPNQLVEIRNLISTIGKEKTVLLSTHILQEVEAICDRVIIINKGMIVANEYTDLLKETIRVADKASPIIYRNLLVKRKRPAELANEIHSHTRAANFLHKQDLAFIYNNYVCEQINKGLKDEL